MVCMDEFARWRNRAFGGKIGSLGMLVRRRVSGKISFTVCIKATTVTSINIIIHEIIGVVHPVSYICVRQKCHFLDAASDGGGGGCQKSFQ